MLFANRAGRVLTARFRTVAIRQDFNYVVDARRVVMRQLRGKRKKLSAEREVQIDNVLFYSSALLGDNIALMFDRRYALPACWFVLYDLPCLVASDFRNGWKTCQEIEFEWKLCQRFG